MGIQSPHHHVIPDEARSIDVIASARAEIHGLRGECRDRPFRGCGIGLAQVHREQSRDDPPRWRCLHAVRLLVGSAELRPVAGDAGIPVRRPRMRAARRLEGT